MHCTYLDIHTPTHSTPSSASNTAPTPSSVNSSDTTSCLPIRDSSRCLLPKDVKQQLKNVPKDALIDGLLDLQKKLEKTVGEKKDEQGRQGEVGDWKTGWGKEQSGEDGKKDGKGEEGKGNEWGGAGQDGGNWAGW